VRCGSAADVINSAHAYPALFVGHVAAAGAADLASWRCQGRVHACEHYVRCSHIVQAIFDQLLAMLLTSLERDGKVEKTRRLPEL
jgi:hypothetical protein